MPLDRTELEAFISLLIQCDVNRNNHALLPKLWDVSKRRLIYRATMSLQRFQHLLRFIRFDDQQRRDTSDRFSPIRHVFGQYPEQLPRHFVPNLNLTVQRQM